MHMFPLYLLALFLLVGTYYTRRRISKYFFPPTLEPVGTTLRPGEQVTTVFFAGLGADFNQVARCVGPEGIFIPGHGRVHNPLSAKLIHNPWLGVHGDAGTDVQPFGVYRECPWWWPSTLYAHFVSAMTGIRNVVPTYHNLFEYNIAQEDDIRKALAMTRSALSARPHDSIVLMGTSRGGGVALQVAARLTKEEAARIKLLILEGVFDSAATICEARYGPWLGALAHSILPFVTRYRHNGVTPLQTAATFPHKTMPIVVITSKMDWHVPRTSTLRIAEALKAQVLELNKSTHSDYATDDNEDRKAYARLLQVYYDRPVNE